MEWTRALNAALSYVEAHLEGELSMPRIAEEAHYSNFHLQRVFAMMTGMTLAEYARQRRLSLAGQALQATDAKVIDVALRFGYETPESFQKAFRRFHGVTPSAAKLSRAPLRYLSPLRLQITLTGGSIMDYTLEPIGELVVLGKERRFRYDAAFSKVPEFWDAYYGQGLNKIVPGFIGVCFDEAGGDEFQYLIGCFAGPDDATPEGFTRHVIAPNTWAKFRAVGPMPGAIQKVNRQIYTEWLPNNAEYELADSVNIEVYLEGDMQSADYESEIWLPVAKKRPV